MTCPFNDPRVFSALNETTNETLIAPQVPPTTEVTAVIMAIFSPSQYTTLVDWVGRVSCTLSQRV